MNIEFDLIRLKKLMADFYNLAGVPITLFDCDFKCIYGHGATQAFCSNLRMNNGVLEKCIACDNEHFNIAKQSKKTIQYTCHAGVCETITPIFYENTLIAYLMLGKFRDESQTYSSVKIMRECLKKYDVDIAECLKSYKQLPIISDDLIQSAISILKVCVRYIWSDNLIKLNKNMLPLQIEEYITNNLTGDLSVRNLCQKFFVSKQVLYQIFKEEFNDTIKNYISNKRLSKAKELLTTTTFSVEQIAEKSGFSEYNYFIRFFHKKVGVTPLQYRKKPIP